MITQSTHQPTNDERLLAWQSRMDTPGRDDTGQASDSRGHSRSLVGRAFYCLASLIGLAAWFAGIFAVTYIVGALMSVPEPETRCFTTATAETDYCREQRVWGN